MLRTLTLSALALLTAAGAVVVYAYVVVVRDENAAPRPATPRRR